MQLGCEMLLEQLRFGKRREIFFFCVGLGGEDGDFLNYFLQCFKAWNKTN